MKKAELKDVATRYGMGIIREEVTSKGVGLYLVTEEDIPELDALANTPPVCRSAGSGGRNERIQPVRQHPYLPRLLPHKLA